ncbi:hypothetical protein [Nostoc sp.]|uniref:hypothetical protein n=1 Tax=Nostoc sp. TaxID=1180 RepID=UPI002FFA14D5
MSKSIFLTNRKGEAARSWGASALGSQCVGRLRRLEAPGVGFADLKHLAWSPP